MKSNNLAKLPESQLLQMRLCDLNLSVRKTPLMRGVNQLYFELNQKLINFLPHVWLADDWFSPDGVAGFAIPFYLAHPRLTELEKKYIGVVEGNTFHSLMKLLRHETAHALDNAFYLRRNKQRQKLFGLSSLNYPKTYLPNPHSKNFVRHLEDYYAQAHPDEDWAETFAVWLDEKSNWEEKYASWDAIEKLELLDNIVSNLSKQKCFSKTEISSINEDTRTLQQYFTDKRKDLRLNRHKPLIQKIDTHHISYVVNNKKEIRKILLEQQGVNSFIVNKFLKDFSNECKTQKIHLDYKTKVNKSLLEQQLQKATQEYIKQGRHRIVM